MASGLSRVGMDAAEVAALADAFQVVGWSHQFYGEHGDISVDMPGIERLIAGSDSVEEDRLEALSFGRKVISELYAIGDRLPFLTDIFGTRRMKTRVAEIQRYFNNENGKAVAARLMLVEALQSAWSQGRPVILIGHSFGSVIAYDSLWELSRQDGNPGVIDLFVSMGSPLTMRRIQRHLKGMQKHGSERYPANIRHWLNLTAIGEVTSLDRTMTDCFSEMAQLRLVETIEDNLELVNQFHGPDGLNVHKCYGYMASAAVAQMFLRSR